MTRNIKNLGRQIRGVSLHVKLKKWGNRGLSCCYPCIEATLYTDIVWWCCYEYIMIIIILLVKLGEEEKLLKSRN